MLLRPGRSRKIGRLERTSQQEWVSFVLRHCANLGSTVLLTTVQRSSGAQLWQVQQAAGPTRQARQRSRGPAALRVMLVLRARAEDGCARGATWCNLRLMPLTATECFEGHGRPRDVDPWTLWICPEDEELVVPADINRDDVASSNRRHPLLLPAFPVVGAADSDIPCTSLPDVSQVMASPSP